MAEQSRIPTPPVTEKVSDGTPEGDEIGRAYRTLEFFQGRDATVTHFGAAQVITWRDTESDDTHTEPGMVCKLFTEMDSPDNDERLVCFRTYEREPKNRFGIFTKGDEPIQECELGELQFHLTTEALLHAAEIARTLPDNLALGRQRGFIPFKGWPS